MMGRIKTLSLGVFFSFIWLSSVQAWQLELPTPIPWIGLIVSGNSGLNSGLKLSLPFLGGVVKHTLTVSSAYNDAKQALKKGSKFVVRECLGGFPKTYTFADPIKKRVAVALAAGCLRDELLKKKLKEFYDIKQKINTASTAGEKKALQKQCIELKYVIKRLMK